MHAAWFNEGAPVPTGTVQCYLMVPPNTQLQDETYIINPSTTLLTAVDIYSRTIPATTTVKIDIKTSSADIVNPIQNTSVFYTYTGPFTLLQALPTATVGPVYYFGLRAFDTVTGPGIQTPFPDYFQTVLNDSGSQ